MLSFDKGKGYRDKPDHSTSSATGRVVGLIPITLPLVKKFPGAVSTNVAPPVLSFDKGKGYRDKPDHSTSSATGRVVGLIPITLPLVSNDAIVYNNRNLHDFSMKGDKIVHPPSFS